MGKGRPLAAITSPSPSSCSVPEAPVFRPTDEEFADPLAYVARIRLLAEPYGICRIVPPPSWSPPRALDVAALSFPTKRQPIHRLLARPAPADPDTFFLNYTCFLKASSGHRRGRKKTPPKSPALSDGRPLDLEHLYEYVCEYEKFTNRLLSRNGKKGKHGDCGEAELDDEPSVSGSQDKGRNNSDAGGVIDGEVSCVGGRKRRNPIRKEAAGMASHGRYKRKRRKLDATATVVNEAVDQVCGQCNSGLHGDAMLLCDRCDKGWHLYCLSPPLESVPLGNWYCSDCMNSDRDCFGFIHRRETCLLETFRRFDERVRRRWFGQRNPSRVQVEKQFWEIVEGKAGELEVMYGSDLDTSIYGSGFPRLGDPVPSSVDPEMWQKKI